MTYVIFLFVVTINIKIQESDLVETAYCHGDGEKRRSWRSFLVFAGKSFPFYVSKKRELSYFLTFSFWPSQLISYQSSGAKL